MHVFIGEVDNTQYWYKFNNISNKNLINESEIGKTIIIFYTKGKACRMQAPSYKKTCLDKYTIIGDIIDLSTVYKSEYFVFDKNKFIKITDSTMCQILRSHEISVCSNIILNYDTENSIYPYQV